MSIFKRLPAINDHGFDLPIAIVDLDLQSAEEERVILSDLFDIRLQQQKDAIEIPT